MMASGSRNLCKVCGGSNLNQTMSTRRIFRKLQRAFCTAEIPPLNVPLPGTETSPTRTSFKQTTNVKSKLTGFRQTTLPNGLRVASEDSFGQYCTVGVLIDAGSRYEVDYPPGLSHILEKMAFQSTVQYPDYKAITEEMESLGGMIDCQSFRDCMIYAASSLASNLAGTMNVLSQAVWHPVMTEEEVEEQKRSVEFELETLQYRTEPEAQMTDLIHAAAFTGNTLGLPKICPVNNIAAFTPGILRDYTRRYYLPSRMTIAAVNVEHEELVNLSEKLFMNTCPVWEDNSMVIPEPDRSVAQYSPGYITEHRSTPRIQPGITPLPELSHVAIGFEGASFVDKDFFAFAVINMLLGGGGSFSAGGPGKGLYTRLYLNVLNRHHWIYSATAFNHSYVDSGVFTILGSAHPSQVKELVQVILQEFLHLAHGPMHQEEVIRAKKQLQSTLMMNLESRVTVFEDIGRQVLGLGYRKSPQELYESIEAVTIDDLKRAAEKMLSSRPAIAAMGDLSKLPSYDDIQKGLLNQGKMSGGVKRFFLNRFSQ